MKRTHWGRGRDVALAEEPGSVPSPTRRLPTDFGKQGLIKQPRLASNSEQSSCLLQPPEDCDHSTTPSSFLGWVCFWGDAGSLTYTLDRYGTTELHPSLLRNNSRLCILR